MFDKTGREKLRPSIKTTRLEVAVDIAETCRDGPLSVYRSKRGYLKER